MASVAIKLEPSAIVYPQAQPSTAYTISRIDTRGIADLASVWFLKNPSLIKVQRTPSPDGYACIVKQESIGRELGFSYSRVYRRNLLIDHLVVDPELKCQKEITSIVTALLNHLIASAKKNNCQSVSICKIKTSNDQLYNGLGFIEQGDNLSKPITRKNRALHFPFLAKKDKLPIYQPFHIPLDEYPRVIEQLKLFGHAAIEKKITNLAESEEIIRMIGVKNKGNQYTCIALLNLSYPEEIKIDAIVHFDKVIPNIKLLKEWLAIFSRKSGRKITYTSTVTTREKRTADGLTKALKGAEKNE